MVEDKYKLTVENVNRTVKHLQVYYEERGGNHYWYLNEFKVPSEWIMKLNPNNKTFEVCREVTYWYERITTDSSYEPKSCRSLPKAVRKLRRQYEERLKGLKEKRIREKLRIMAGDFEECD
jgi:hypothetical protein